MSARVPVEGLTLAYSFNVDKWELHSPNGLSIEQFSVEEHEEFGIPVPPEQRVGRLGLNEADTRSIAGIHPFTPDCTAYLAWNAAISMCAEDVALWDEQDRQASRPKTPLGLSEADVRRATRWGPGDWPADLADAVEFAAARACCEWVAAVDGVS